MRIGLPRMLLISFALHLSLAIAVLLTLQIRSSSRPVSAAAPRATLVFTLPAVRVTPRELLTASTSPAPARPVISPTTFAAPSHLSKYDVAAHLPTTLPPLREHSPRPADQVLAPSPAPRLNSRDGVVFVLDISGSMYEPYAGTTRLTLARQWLGERLRSLKDGTPFALVVYGERALRSGPLVAANDATREAAVRFIDQEYDCGGGTNLPAGLTLASQSRVGGIVVVTDGDLNMEPTELLPQVHAILGSPGPALTLVGISPRANTGDQKLLASVVHQQGGTLQIQQAIASAPLLTADKPE